MEQSGLIRNPVGKVALSGSPLPIPLARGRAVRQGDNVSLTIGCCAISLQESLLDLNTIADNEISLKALPNWRLT
jgi:hypothetical protein